MDVKVRFRLNKATGEVEIFEIADDGPMILSEADHNREHDRIATELGNVVERNPQIDEVFGGSQPVEPLLMHPAEQQTAETENVRQDSNRRREGPIGE